MFLTGNFLAPSLLCEVALRCAKRIEGLWTRFKRHRCKIRCIINEFTQASPLQKNARLFRMAFCSDQKGVKTNIKEFMASSLLHETVFMFGKCLEMV